MSKRLRLFWALVFTAFGVWFLFPTLNWYVLLGNETKEISSLSRTNIKEVSQEYSQIIYNAIVKKAKLNNGDSPFSEYPSVGDIYPSILENVVLKNLVPSYKTLDATKSVSLYEAELQSLIQMGCNAVLTQAKTALAKNGVTEEPAIWTYKAVLNALGQDSATGLFAKVNSALTNQFRDYYIGVKNSKRAIINLGLDLQGGVSAVLQAKLDKLNARIKSNLGKDEADREASTKEKHDAIDNAVENLKSRFDGFGVSEPGISADYDNLRIILDLPGSNDEDRITQVLTSSGDLRLQLEDETLRDKLNEFVTNFRNTQGRDYDPKLDASFAPAELNIPGQRQIRQVIIQDDFGIDTKSGYIVTKEDPNSVVLGEHIIGANPNNDNNGKVVVNFKLDAVGATQFATLTANNVQKPLAIILNEKSRGIPINISEAINGGSVQISGSFSQSDATALSKVLKSSALPIDFIIEGISSVGASLGDIPIQRGVNALLLGFILVAGFMVIYYLGSGFVAVFSLVVNTFLVMAVLSAFGLTLTLTSIAGLILTVGMSVDSNVIIFERIKDELRLGKDRGASVRAGYQKAFWTIVDGHVTTLIASVLLGFLGTGPIKGFAVTLTVGIIINLYTSLVVTRLIQDFSTEQLKLKRMSISWRKI